MNKYFYTILCFVLFTLFQVEAYSQSVYVSLNNPVYEYIERFETRGVLLRVLNGIKPFSRKEAAEFLLQIRSANGSEVEMSKVELEQLKYFEKEFAEELLELGYRIKRPEKLTGLGAQIKKRAPEFIYSNGRNLLEVKKEDFSIYADLILNQDNSLTDSSTTGNRDDVLRYTSGIRIRGNIGERFGFYADARNTKEWGTRDYPRGEDQSGPGLGWANNYSDYQFHDEVTAYVIVGLGNYFEFEFGKLQNRWGPGYRGGLILNDYATSFDQVKLKSKFWRIKFVQLFGSLVQLPRIVESVSEEENGFKKNYAMKYISAHRMEINLFDGFDLGIHESIIYGQRSIELSYLNPVMFFWSAEHYLGDQDNSLIGLDFELYRIKGWKVYGEFLIDDITTKKLGTDWFGNKFGTIIGALWTNPFKIHDTSLRFEYTRIKPFVYSHKFAINKYKNFLSGLGHSLPPNSDEFFISVNHYISRKMRIEGEFIRQRHGSNPPGENVGGDIDLAHRNEIDRDYIGFLEGDVEKTSSLKIKFSYEPFRNLFIKSYCNLLSGKNFRINNVPGQDFDSKKFFLGISLNY